MSENKKRYRLPKEDLAATVADIINSPITRSNLSFLRPLPTVDLEVPKPPEPIGVAPSPIPFESKPVGVGPTSHFLDEHLASHSQQPSPETVDEAPRDADLTPLGLTSQPMGLGLENHGPNQHGIGGPSSLGDKIPGLDNSAPMGFGDRKPQSWEPINRPQPLWQTEGLGTVFEQTRVRRIHQAQDALSLIEEKVYDLLWGPKNQKRDDSRLVHYSLQRIATEARINIKTVRELIPRLIDKGFITIEHEADVRRNIPTLYRVSSYTAALNDQKRRNRAYVTKTGKGVFYVHPISASFKAAKPMGFERQPPPYRPGGPMPGPLGDGIWPGGLQPTGAMGSGGSKPMGASGPPSIDNLIDNSIRQTTTTTYAALVDSIKEGLGVEPDEALLGKMIAACHRNALDTTSEVATDEELIYFTATKARVLARAANIRNHLAVLRKAVPECFLGETFRAYRAASVARKKKAIEHEQRAENERLAFERERAEQEAQYALWATVSERHRGERGYDMREIADDEELDDRGKQQARGMLERLGRFTRSGL